VTKEDGTFSIPTKGLEDGTYEIEIWHEKLAAEPITQEIEVKDGKATVEEVKIPADGGEARADEVEGDVKLASIEDNACKLGGACCADKAAAVAAVLTFRLATFWLPVPFGAWSLSSLRKTGHL